MSDAHALAGRNCIRMVELHQQWRLLMAEYFATRTLLEGWFRASGAEPIVVVEMSTVSPRCADARPGAADTDRRGRGHQRGASGDERSADDPDRNPGPIRTPGILWRLDGAKAAPVASFAGLVRKTALGKSWRHEGPARRRFITIYRIGDVN